MICITVLVILFIVFIRAYDVLITASEKAIKYFITVIFFKTMVRVHFLLVSTDRERSISDLFIL